MSTLPFASKSSVDRLLAPSDMKMAPWWYAYYGISVLEHAEKHINKITVMTRPEAVAVQKLRDARADLRAVMEYLRGLEEVQS